MSEISQIDTIVKNCIASPMALFSIVGKYKTMRLVDTFGQDANYDKMDKLIAQHPQSLIGIYYANEFVTPADIKQYVIDDIEYADRHAS